MLTPKDIYTRLIKTYPDAKISLSYKNPLELLIAVILSAQCTDKRVNIVTKELFKRYKTAKDYAESEIDELKCIIRPTGFYNSKAKHIRGTCTIIVEKHGGMVPSSMESLLELPGVARKTANIVLSNAYNKNEGIAVDTHVKRLSFRMGLTKNTNPVKIEKDLMRIFPRKDWNKITYYLIEHGRKICKAPVPRCSECIFTGECLKKGISKQK